MSLRQKRFIDSDAHGYEGSENNSVKLISESTTGVLSLNRIDVFYGKYQALFDVSFKVQKGEALAITGLNGAGKTTLTRVISGLVQPRSGCIYFNGENITGMRIEKINSRGLDLIPDRSAVFNSLSVTENLRIFFYKTNSNTPVEELVQRSFDLFPRLKERGNHVAGNLSGGEQRMLSLAKALVDPPEFLVVDELSMGLAPRILDEIWKRIEEIKSSGTTMLLVEQYSRDVEKVASREIRLEKGQIVGS